MALLSMHEPSQPYPTSPAARSRWIVERRPARAVQDPQRAIAWLREDEPAAPGHMGSGITVFLANRECPWRCLMCDLWRHTLEESVQDGDILAQMDHAFAALGVDASRGGGGRGLDFLKLYNAGSFFDPKAIPRADWGAIAARVAGARRVVVECHPSLVGPACVEFRDALAAAARNCGACAPTLEVAMGLEVAHPEVLEKLNKRMTLEDFSRATRFLRNHGIDVRAFVLVGTPFIPSSDAVAWAVRTSRFAFEQGARVVSSIPVRPGNGSLDALRTQGAFTPPTLAMFEEAHDATVLVGGGMVLADLWDLGVFSSCSHCLPARRDRMERMNLYQRVEPRVDCARCGAL